MNADKHEDVFQAISNFYASRTYTLLNRRMLTVPFMEAIGKSRSETCHSAFLNWLFQSNELQYSVAPPATSLLRLLAARSMYDSDLMDNTLCTEILTNNIEVYHVESHPEQSTSSKFGNGRSDLEIIVKYRICRDDIVTTKSIRIIIENKIDSHEGKNQCKKYYEHYQRKNDVDYTLYTYLAPITPDKLSSKHFITITYQDILNKVILPLSHDNGILSTRTQAYITMFAENITSLRNNKSKIQIAMDAEIKSLLTDFYKNNEELILAAIDAAAPDEIREKVKEVMSGKDYTSYRLTYSVNGNITTKEITAKSRLAKTFVEVYCEMNPSATLSDVTGVLNNIKNNLISTNEKDRTYKIDGKDWYIESGIWGKKSKYFESLLEVIKKYNITLDEF